MYNKKKGVFLQGIIILDLLQETDKIGSCTIVIARGCPIPGLTSSKNAEKGSPKRCAN